MRGDYLFGGGGTIHRSLTDGVPGRGTMNGGWGGGGAINAILWSIDIYL